MRKLLFIITLLLVNISIFAQDKQDTAKYVTNSNVEKLVDKYSAKLSASITSLAQTLKQPAEHVYKVLVKQQVVKSITNLVIIIILILLGTLFIIIESKILEDNWKDPVFGVIGIVALVVALIWLAIGANAIFGGFINPEYGAIKEIVEMIK